MVIRNGDVQDSKFRIAFRVEGEVWTAYLANTDTMTGAIWMGSIAMQLVLNAKRKQAFMDLMKSAMNDAVKAMGSKVTSWGEQQAPESERAGRA